MKKLKPLILFFIGGALYLVIEIAWRYFRCGAPTHWSMFFVGGIAFILIGGLNNYLPWDMPFWAQTAIGTVVALIVELISGCILNIWLGLGIWDYSNMAFNILGQVCISFAIAWVFLVAIAIVLDDYIRYWLFKEKRPRYYW